MVNEMYGFEEFGQMHQSMHPIEVGIMEKEHPDEGEEIVELAILPRISTEDVCIGKEHKENEHGYCGKHHNSNERIDNVSVIVFVFGKFDLNPAKGRESS